VILGGLGALWLFSTKLTTPEWKVWIPVEIQLYLPGIFNQAPLLFTLLTGGSFLFLLGLYDDRRPLPAKVKLGLQLGVAFFFLIHFLDVESEERSIQFLVRFYWISFPLLLLWIVGITNAFNLLDNMDGLSSGVVFISALNLLMVCLNTKQPFVGALLLVLMGANLGFLLYNFSPAKIFMGDCGSLFMGYLIAVSMILCFTAQEGEWFYPLVVPLLILAVPLYDTFSVMWIRLRSGRSIFQADNHHFSHRLVALGFSRPAAVCLIYLVTFTTGITATLLDRVDLRGGILISLQVFCTLMIIALLEGSSLPKKEESVKK
jgi:UDP-GlcNAc:undecaprenyl-phosphate GlcNAc-1-phosphate transferase